MTFVIMFEILILKYNHDTFDKMDGKLKANSLFFTSMNLFDHLT